MLESILESYKRDGVAKTRGLFDDSDMEILRREPVSIFPAVSSPVDHADFLGCSISFDAAIERLLRAQVIQDFLGAALGSGYRLYTAALRRSSAGAPQIRMHQDRPGETKLSVLLTDALDDSGTTVFYPGSHRWPFVMNAFPCPPRWLRRSTIGCIGAVGDVYCFPGRLWHGRLAARKATNIVALLSFLPAWAPYASRLIPLERFEKISPWMRSLLDGSATLDSGIAEPEPCDERYVDVSNASLDLESLAPRAGRRRSHRSSREYHPASSRRGAFDRERG